MPFVTLASGVSRANQQKADMILDSSGLPVGFSSEFGDRSIVAMFRDVTASRSVSFSDVENVLRANSGSAIVLTVENDTVLGIDSRITGVVHTIAAYQAGLGAVSFTAGSGVTLRGTPPTAAQYTTVGIMRVGANEWAYL